MAIAANLLRWRGFDVVELGANTPAAALAETAAGQPDLVAVGLACTTEASRRAVGPAITTVRRAAPGIPILLGGAAITDTEGQDVGRRRLHRGAGRRGRARRRGHRGRCCLTSGPGSDGSHYDDRACSRPRQAGLAITICTSLMWRSRNDASQ